jgi:hypothetical protein
MRNDNNGLRQINNQWEDSNDSCINLIENWLIFWETHYYRGQRRTSCSDHYARLWELGTQSIPSTCATTPVREAELLKLKRSLSDVDHLVPMREVMPPRLP